MFEFLKIKKSINYFKGGPLLVCILETMGKERMTLLVSKTS